MLYKTLKVAAGRHSFDIGQELEFNDAEAAALLADGAITPLTPSETLAQPRPSRPGQTTPPATEASKPESPAPEDKPPQGKK